MSIDTTVEGEEGSITAAATWLRSSLRRELDGAADDVTEARRTATSGFHGEAGDAYASYGREVLGHLDDHAARVGRAAGVFDDYAARLGRFRSAMEGFRAQARGGGLVVSGAVIQAPAPAVPPDVPVGPVAPELADQHARQVSAFETALARVELYNRLVVEVQAEDERFVDWVETHVVAEVASFTADAVDSLMEFLRDNVGNIAITGSMLSGERALQRRAGELADQARDLRRARRSGNPARRALGNAPDTPGRINDLLEQSRWAGRGSRLLGPAGTAVDVWFALEGESPAGGLVAAGLGIGATALVIATAPVSVPTAVVVGGAIVVGAGVTWLATEGWDALPDDLTEPVDEWVGDRWDDTKDLASDGWNEVKSWF